MRARGAFYSPIDPSGSASNLNGVDPPLYTPARMRITINAATGNDAGTFTVANETIIAPDGVTSINYGDTWFLTARTIVGALARVPTVLRHPVFIDLPTGTTTAADGGAVGGPELDVARFICTGTIRIIDLATGKFDAAAGLYLNGTQTETLGNTIANIFSATTIGRNTLGMGVDAHRGAIVEIMTGTGRGQWRRCIRNNATTLQLADAWSVTPDGTSVFRVWRPGSNLDATIIVSCGDTTTHAGLVIAPDVSINDGGVSSSPLTINEGGFVACGAQVTDGGSGFASVTMVGGTLFAQWVNLARDPFLQRVVGPFFGSGSISCSYRAAFIGSGVTSVFEASAVTISINSDIDIRVDADGGGSGATFLAVEESNGQLRRPDNANAQITGYATGLTVTKNANVRISGAALAIANSSAHGVLVSEGGNLEASALAGTGNATYGMIVRGGGVFSGAQGATITGATAELRLGNATSGTDLTWATVPANDAITDPVEAATVRYTAGV